MKKTNRYIKLFNQTYLRACWHHKRKIRKKNYRRAQYMMIRMCNWPKDFFINKEKYINAASLNQQK